ncbi:MAG: LamG domain-containing protein [Victivallaceae bacterium]|nr:LamG domain-containing protein [Victivallaceae bacterium]
MYKFIKPNHHPVNKKGLVAWYSYRNTGSVAALGTCKDYSGNGNDGICNGNVFVDNQGAKFDGSPDYIDIGSDSSLDLIDDDFTISVWVKKLSLAATYSRMVTNNIGSTDDGYSFHFDNNASLCLFVKKAGSILFSKKTTPLIAIDQWYHVVAAFDSATPGNSKLYIDGESKSLNPFSTNLAGSAGAVIGKRQDNLNITYMMGYLADIQIYNRALLACEIKQNYLKNRRA